MHKNTRRTEIDNQEDGFYQFWEDGKPGKRVAFDTLKAAPDMLEVLQTLAKMNTSIEYPNDVNNAIIDARVIIAKATDSEDL